jgi:ABC-type branched-subunit amino acid transport system ATPase component
VSLVDPNFLVDSSLTLVAVVVIGGMGSTVGAVLGTLWVIGLPALAPGNSVVPLLSSSLGLLVLLLYFPGGFIEVAHRTRGALYRHLERRLPPAEKTTTAPPAALGRTARPTVTHDVVLRTTGLSVSFGGHQANDHVSIDVRAGEIVGLIGTNGAGKSTLMNAIGGFVPADGQIAVLGRDVTGMPAYRRHRVGLGRTFQAARLYDDLTVRETVMVALEARGRSRVLPSMLHVPPSPRAERRKRAEADDILAVLGLSDTADQLASVLSTGTRRLVELAGQLALGARVVLLDEPTAGLSQHETEAFAPRLRDIQRDLDAAVLLIEHDMPLVMSVSDRVYCLEAGVVIAEGSPAEVRADPLVIASYLGADDAGATTRNAPRISG